MPVFEYEVVDSAGTIGRGREQAEDSAELLQQFRNRGQLVVSLRAADAPRAAPLRQVLQQSRDEINRQNQELADVSHAADCNVIFRPRTVQPCPRRSLADRPTPRP